MRPSETIILRRISPNPVLIRALDTGVLLTLLAGGFALSVPETIGVQSELDRRRERRWQRHGRHFFRYAPRLTDATEQAFGSGFFDNRYFDFRQEDFFAVSF